MPAGFRFTRWLLDVHDNLLTGMYLSFPQVFAAGFDFLEPFDASNPVERVVDRIQYWLAYLHFGRFGGRGIPGCGRGLCDSMTKVIWAVFGLVPPLMWWNRVIRPARRMKASQPSSPFIADRPGSRR